MTDPLGNVTTYSYTNTGKTASEVDAYGSGGATSLFYYDNDDRLTTYIDVLDETTVDGYDAVGNKLHHELKWEYNKLCL